MAKNLFAHGDLMSDEERANHLHRVLAMAVLNEGGSVRIPKDLLINTPTVRIYYEDDLAANQIIIRAEVVEKCQLGGCENDQMPGAWIEGRVGDKIVEINVCEHHRHMLDMDPGLHLVSLKPLEEKEDGG